MSKLIIVEGADCSGKSTLARQIAIQKNAMHIHAVGDKPLHPAMRAYHNSLLSIAEENMRNGHTVVMDRFWPSEYVYGQLFRPQLSNDTYDYPEMFMRLHKLCPIYVYCHDPEIEMRHRNQKDPNHPFTDSAIRGIIFLYEVLFSEMQDSPALPNMHHPKTEPGDMRFDVRRYSVLTNGMAMGTFVDTL